MCLGIPGRVIERWDDGLVPMGKVVFDGIVKEVCLAYVPEISIGDYVIVHVGFAITKIDEQSALETLGLFQNLGLLDEELRASEQHTSGAEMGV